MMIMTNRHEDYERTAKKNRIDLYRYYHLPELFTYKNRAAVLSAGLSDNISFFKDKNSIYVIATNQRLGYAGMEEYDLELNQTGEVFFQNAEDDTGIKCFFDLSETRQAKLLIQWIN